ncbi:flagellar biosynthesis protein FlgL (plasmid) [Azospirillum baldaniorum]|uniref:Flagellin n=1 Tax=Azospirillum baldaniorum TaxID=1064539 RepID=A0A9P1NR77_9PROT|nr:flagellin [Azospirillum baldaniorum]AWJ92663.1 flagellar biosynthesis protein FlgL [Azospirillum baldaniorum]TWA78071.1 flagellar hook-associated protein 3 FlgL [Azospirillum brasilense]CCD02824.1 putative flagellar hook-associated protein FlgL-like [Azospirillum baldaniorum]
MERIATFNHQNQLVRYMLAAESRVATAQVQAATGEASVDYKGIAGDSGRLVNLESHYRRSERYVDEGEVVNGRIQTMHDAVGGMIDLANRVRSLVASLQGAGSGAADGIKSEAQALMTEFAGLLNTQQEGRYLFAGGRTDRAAVSLDGLPAATSPSTADTGYYKGDGSVSYFQAADDLIVQYGVTADDPSIEKALRSISLIANMPTNPVDTTLVDEASDLADAAADGLTVVQTKLGSASATLERTIDRHLEQQLVLQTHVEDIRNIDLAEATTRLSQLQANLESTMSLMKILQQTNLNDFL